MFDWLINLFKGKEPDEVYPYKYAEVKLTQVAKSKGTIDNHNKVIRIFIAGKVVEEIPYTEEALESLKNVEEIPIFEEQLDDEDVEFDEMEDLGTAQYRKW